MPPIINQIDCGTEAKNTGYGKCAFDLGFARKFLRVADPDHVFTPAEILALEDTLRDMILADKENRLYPYPNWEQLSDSSDEIAYQTLGYGRKTPGSQGYNDWTFDFLDGAHCVHIALMSHDGSGSFLVVDSNLRIWGVTVPGGMKGIPMDQTTLKLKLADGTNATKYQVRFIVDPIFFGRDLAVVEKVVGFNPLLLQGLQDVNLELAAGSTATSVKFTAVTGCAMKSMGDLFPAAVILTANYYGLAAAGGAVVTPTAAAFNTTTKIITLTFAAAVSAASFVSAADLADAGVDGYEANVLSPVVS